MGTMLLIMGVIVIWIVSMFKIFWLQQELDELEYELDNIQDEWDKRCNICMNNVEDRYEEQIKELKDKRNLNLTRIRQYEDTIILLRERKNWLKDRVSKKVFNEYQIYKDNNKR